MEKSSFISFIIWSNNTFNLVVVYEAVLFLKANYYINYGVGDIFNYLLAFFLTSFIVNKSGIS